MKAYPVESGVWLNLHVLCNLDLHGSSGLIVFVSVNNLSHLNTNKNDLEKLFIKIVYLLEKKPSLLIIISGKSFYMEILDSYSRQGHGIFLTRDIKGFNISTWIPLIPSLYPKYPEILNMIKLTNLPLPFITSKKQENDFDSILPLTNKSSHGKQSSLLGYIYDTSASLGSIITESCQVKTNY